MKNSINKRDIIREREAIKEPGFYQVWIHGDDFTPRDFVVGVLESFFSMDRRKAIDVMLEARANGIAACGKYTKDVADTLLSRAIEFARKHEHPLLCSMEAT